MKIRDSGMPNEAYWSEFFNADEAIKRLIPENARHGDWLEVGCGYGTFTLAAAQRISGTLSAADIDADMVAFAKQRAEQLQYKNIRFEQRDIIQDGAGLPHYSQAGVMVYNLLHLEEPVTLLSKLRQVLLPRGQLSIIHWRSDIPTPRGPCLSIRPSPEQCSKWLLEAGFDKIDLVDISKSCPYHFGLLASNK